MSTFYRSVWISDVHLCSKDAQVEMLHSFISSIKCDYLYLVGDIIDVWALRKKWYWPAMYNELVHKLLKRSRKGAKVIFIPGNHDERVRQFSKLIAGNIRIEKHFIHEMADGRRFLLCHGDEFDVVSKYAAWLAFLGDRGYGILLDLNQFFNWLRSRLGFKYWSLSAYVKFRVKKAVNYISDFEETVALHAQRAKLDGVICGHIHHGEIRPVQGVTYANCGDWVESCTALVEHYDGRLELIHWPDRKHKSGDQETLTTVLPVQEPLVLTR